MARYRSYRKNVKLQPGQIIAFAPGRGYYAKAKARPKPPVDPYASKIDVMVTDALRPQRQELAAQRERTIGLAKALAELNSDIGPATNKAYQDAAATLGALAQGYTGAARGAAEADAAAARETLTRIGAPGAAIGNVMGVGHGAEDATYAVGGAIPGGALAREGAAAAAAANMLPATARGRGQYDVMGIDREERELLAGIPKIRQEFRNQLIGEAMAEEELKIKQDAQRLYEKNYGLDVEEASEKQRHNKATEAAARRRAALTEKNYQLALKRHGLAVKNASRQGREVDAAASKGLGKLVDQNGKPILDKNGNEIPFKTGGSSKSGGLTPYQQSQVRAQAIETARDLRGEPVESEGMPGQGKYVAREGATGSDVKTDPNGIRTTNNPRKAARDSEYTFAEAQAQLVAAYGISRAKARAFLISAGWKAPKKQKQPKPQPKSGR